MFNKNCCHQALVFVFLIIFSTMLIKTEIIGDMGEVFFYQTYVHDIDEYQAMLYANLDNEFGFCKSCHASFLDQESSEFNSDWCQSCCFEYRAHRGDII